jgi:hypothetical protein
MITLANEPGKRVIASLAILTSNLAEGRDYIDLFVPLVCECIWAAKPQVVAATDLQAQMRDTFGIQIPQNALKLVLHKAARKGYVKRQNMTYAPNFEVLAGLNFAPRYQDVIRQQNAAISKLVAFSADRFRITLTESEAENALLAYLQKHDIEILDCFLNLEAPVLFKPESTKQLDYIVGLFVAECHKSDPDGFKYIDTIVKGLFLSHTLFFPDLGQIKKRFHRTQICFDTALLLRILGYEGEARQEPCKELLDLLYREGAALNCFRNTCDEVANILHACMIDMGKEDTKYAGPTFNYLKGAGYEASDIELELALLDSKIEDSGIRIVDLPEYSTTFQIDEQKLDKALRDKTVYWQERQRQRKHDVDCLSAIYRLRKGRESIYIEDSIATFVTANLTLCNVAAKFLVAEAQTDRNCAPIAITDYALTALLWLKTPMHAPDLPVKRIIAECYAAVEPSERMWSKYIQTASRLKENQKISANDYYLLRYSQLAHKELMELTMGDENIITDGTIEEILETVKVEIRKDDLALLEQERYAHEETRKDSLIKIEEERRLREESERNLAYELTVNKRKWESLSQNIEQKSRRVAKYASIFTFVTAMLLVSAGALFSSIHWWGHKWNYALLACYAIFLFFSILSVVYGVTIRDCISRLEVYLADRIQRVLNRLFLPQG